LPSAGLRPGATRYAAPVRIHAAKVLIFSQQFRVFALDLRGHGRTNNPVGALGYPAMADDVAAFCAALRLDRPFVCGHSDGGNVALELGMRRPDLSRALVVSGMIHSAPDRYTAALGQYLGAHRITSAEDLERIEEKLPELANTLRGLHDVWQRPGYLSGARGPLP